MLLVAISLDTFAGTSSEFCAVKRKNTVPLDGQYCKKGKEKVVMVPCGGGICQANLTSVEFYKSSRCSSGPGKPMAEFGKGKILDLKMVQATGWKVSQGYPAVNNEYKGIQVDYSTGVASSTRLPDLPEVPAELRQKTPNSVSMEFFKEDGTPDILVSYDGFKPFFVHSIVDVTWPECE